MQSPSIDFDTVRLKLAAPGRIQIFSSGLRKRDFLATRFSPFSRHKHRQGQTFLLTGTMSLRTAFPRRVPFMNPITLRNRVVPASSFQRFNSSAASRRTSAAVLDLAASSRTGWYCFCVHLNLFLTFCSCSRRIGSSSLDAWRCRYLPSLVTN